MHCIDLHVDLVTNRDTMLHIMTSWKNTSFKLWNGHNLSAYNNKKTPTSKSQIFSLIFFATAKILLK